MICRGCGQKISFLGKVCPHCQRDKTADAEADSRLMLITFGFGFSGALIGYVVSDGFLNEIVATFIGMITGSIVGLLFAFIVAEASKPSLPPEVRIQPEAKVEDTIKKRSFDPDIESRLVTLQELREKSLITPDEYTAKRAQILSSI